MAVKRMRMLPVSVRKMKALTLKMETVIVIDEGIWEVTCRVYYVCEIDIEFFFVADIFFGRGGGSF
jgi:hypothetical protein